MPSVSPSSQGSETEAYYYVYDYQGTSVIGAKETENFQNYGGLYNWVAATTACPEGWYLPDDIEWFSLIYFVGNENTAGGILKSTRTAPDPHPRWLAPNTGATDGVDFSSLPGGRAIPTGFQEIGYTSYYWAFKDDLQGNAWRFSMGYASADVYGGTKGKILGYSVRCIKEGPPQLNLPPEIPSKPSPETGSINQTTTPTLTWECSDPEGDPLTFDVYYGTDENPPLAVSATTEQTYTPTTLEYSTTYYWKIVAHDDKGNSTEGEVWNFTTLPEPEWQCGSKIFDQDGNNYNTVLIGDQCWMKENLKTTKYSNNTPIEYPGSNSSDWENNTIGAFAWYNNDSSWKDIYGALYNWFAVNNANGLCPSGWQVPSNSEWGGLISHIVSQGHPNSNVPNGAGNAIKSCRKENSPLGDDCNTSEHPRWEAHELHHGFDQFGISMLPNGFRGPEGNSSAIGMFGDYWSSTPVDENLAWNRALTYDYGDVGSHSTNSKKYGFAVRCLLINPSPVGYSLNLTVDPIFAGTVTGVGQYEAGQQVNITAETSPGWEFVNWTGGNEVVSELPTFIYIMPAEDITLTANFVEEQAGFSCGDPFVDERDGQPYETVQIGDQCWMAENLAFLPTVSPSSQGSESDPYYYVYDYQGTNLIEAKATTNYQNFGVLYNFPAAIISCPQGWYLPSDLEWKVFEGTVDSQYPVGDGIWDLTGYRGYDAGFNIKSTSGWLYNGNGIDTFDFNGLPAGNRFSSEGGKFHGIGDSNKWWSATTYNNGTSWLRRLDSQELRIGREYYPNSDGFTVRCVKD